MGKLIGILLILGGCAGLLYQWVKVQRCRALLMEEWIRIFVAFEYALEKEHVPIQRFFLRYDGRLPEVERFFERVLQLLEKNEYPSGQMVWGMVLKEWKKKFALKEEAGHTLRAAGDAFFGENSQENLRCMQGCRQRMEKCVEKEREEFVRQRSVYMPVGMLTGLMLVILLV